MVKLPSRLKGLVETRSRLAGEVDRLAELLADTSAKLKAARQSLGDTDKTIKHYYERLDPTAIKPVRGQKGRYGEHGSLKATITKVLAESKGEPLTNGEVAERVIAKIGLKFPSPDIQREWKFNSLSSELKRMHTKGKVERILQKNGKNTRWKLKPERKVTSLEGLAGLRGGKRAKKK